MTVCDPTLDLHAFLVTRWEVGPVIAAPDEHDDLSWLHPRELADLALAHLVSQSSIASAVRVADN